MAIYHLTTKVVQRSKGHSAVAAAAYRARMEITNERTGETWNYSKNNADVLFAGVFTPDKAPAWMQERSKVWNALEKADRQWNGQVARDFTIALPHELSLEQQRYAVQDWVKENFTRKGFVADIAIHKPSGHGDTRNVHAHVMVSMRTVQGDGFATAKYRSKDKYADLEEWRESWERIGNQKLVRFGHEPTLDRRSFTDQGIDLTPTIHLGKSAAELERDGKATDRGDILRAIQRQNAAKEMQRQLDEVANANAIARDRANDDAPHTATINKTPQVDKRTPAQSAIDRMKAEERAEQIETLREAGRRGRASLPEHVRVVLNALRSLRQTMSSAIADIVKGGDFFKLRSEASYIRAMQERDKATGKAPATRSVEPPPRVADEQKPKRLDQFPEIKQRPALTTEKQRDPVVEQLERMAAERKTAKLKEDAAKLAQEALRGDLNRPTRKPKNDYER